MHTLRTEMNSSEAACPQRAMNIEIGEAVMTLRSLADGERYSRLLLEVDGGDAAPWFLPIVSHVGGCER